MSRDYPRPLFACFVTARRLFVFTMWVLRPGGAAEESCRRCQSWPPTSTVWAEGMLQTESIQLLQHDHPIARSPPGDRDSGEERGGRWSFFGRNKANGFAPNKGQLTQTHMIERSAKAKPGLPVHGARDVC